MNKQPGAIEHAFAVGVRHIWRYFRWSVGAWAVIWIAVMVFDYGTSWSDWLSTTWAVITGPATRITHTLFFGAGVIGVETVSIVFLVIAVWWKSRGDVYRRGARLIDLRPGE